MATLTVESVVSTGLDATYNSAASGGDTFANNNVRAGRVFLHVKNADASSKTVTVTPEITSTTVPGFGSVTKAAIAVAIPAGEDRFIGPLPLTAFGAAPAITYSAVTSVTVAVIEVPA